MATYNYKCDNNTCEEFGKVIEVIHSMKDDKPNCPKCGTQFVVHHTTAPLVTYKGKWFSNSGSY